MSRLIDADAIRKGKFCLNPLHADNDNTYYYQLGWNAAIETICDCVPTVDPVKHGHWLFYEEPDGYYHSECSECGQWCDEDVFLKGKWHYCPNCGAKMDEGDLQ